jgi:ribonuclease HII
MVIAGVVLDENEVSTLKELGVKDSKLLSPKQRELIYTKIIKAVKTYKIIKISPKEIDSYVLSDGKTNLNWLEADKMAEIINLLKPDQSIVDCPSTNIRAFTEYLQNKLTVKTSLKCEHKADLNWPQASAASILAKVTRDAEIEKMKKELRVDFGSGYPSDPLTKKFIKENWDKHPDIFRHSWATYKAYSEPTKKQKNLSDY